MTTLTDLLNEFRELSFDERSKGSMFERFIANVLVTDPLYADKLDQVWLWGEWPHRFTIFHAAQGVSAGSSFGI